MAICVCNVCKKKFESDDIARDCCDYCLEENEMKADLRRKYG